MRAPRGLANRRRFGRRCFLWPLMLYRRRPEIPIPQEERYSQDDGESAKNSRHLSFPGNVLIERGKQRRLAADPVAVKLMPVIACYRAVNARGLKRSRLEDRRQRHLR